jgi:hypothetical protein
MISPQQRTQAKPQSRKHRNKSKFLTRRWNSKLRTGFKNQPKKIKIKTGMTSLVEKPNGGTPPKFPTTMINKFPRLEFSWTDSKTEETNYYWFFKLKKKDNKHGRETLKRVGFPVGASFTQLSEGSTYIPRSPRQSPPAQTPRPSASPRASAAPQPECEAGCKFPRAKKTTQNHQRTSTTALQADDPPAAAAAPCHCMLLPPQSHDEKTKCTPPPPWQMDPQPSLLRVLIPPHAPNFSNFTPPLSL